MDKQTSTPVLLRYRDLRAAGIVRNRTTLQRWINSGHFPAPIKIGPNTSAWRLVDVETWLSQRAAASKTGSAE
jgi:predicted DNA-binding transcriptional regulator AlpA